MATVSVQDKVILKSSPTKTFLKKPVKLKVTITEIAGSNKKLTATIKEVFYFKENLVFLT